MASVLPDRAVISVGGESRIAFLEGLVSCRVDDVVPGDLRYGALLTPQGKIVTDMMIHAFEDRLALDVPVSAADDLVRRLTLYKLRAPVTLERSGEVVVIGGEGPADPRAEGLPTRTVAASGPDDPEAVAAYHRARVEAGVPEATADFALGEAFPHDVNMDLTGGVDFRKGCFVGQEVVSRMRHRGTARRRTVIVEAQAPLPQTGAEMTADGKSVGRLGTVTGERGLAIVRVDRVGTAAEAEGVPVTVRVPEGAPFALAGADAAG